MILLHIGLGKTGSTLLQTCYFSKLYNDGLIDSFNDSGLVRYVVSGLYHGVKDSSFEFSRYNQGLHVISNEDFVGWNPDLWLERCDLLSNLFDGVDVELSIVLREPKSYLRSVYQQMFMQGNVVRPEQFFYLDRDRFYRNLSSRPGVNEGFNLDRFCYASLVNAYQSYFDRVRFIPFEFFFRESGVEIFTGFETCLKGLPQKNRAYSDFSMRLTFALSSFWRFFGLRLISSCDEYLGLSVYEKFNKKTFGSERFAPFYISKLVFRKFFSWRGFIQNILDRVMPYRHYSLPTVEGLEEAVSRNSDFYKRLLR